MFTSTMVHLTAVVLRKDADKISRVLLDQGILDFTKVSDLSFGADKRLSSLDEKVSAARIGENKRRIENIVAALSESPLKSVKLNIDDMKSVDLDKVESELDKLVRDSQDIRGKQREIQKEILKLEDIGRQVEMFGDLRSGIGKSGPYSFLQIQAGSIPSAGLEDFSRDIEAYPSVQLNFGEENGRKVVLLISLKRDEQSVSRVLTKYGWVETDLPETGDLSSETAARDIQSKIKTAKENQARLDEEYKKIIMEKADWLSETWANLTMNKLLSRIRSFFSATRRAVIFSGWLPRDRQKELEASLRKTANNDCVLEWNSAEVVVSETGKKLKAPVQLNNPKALKPFEMLVVNYAVPEYGAVDPTPFVAVAYLLMFGLMFGDVGHGLIIALGGLLFPKLKKNLSEGMKKLSVLLIYCGLSAMAAGVLFGSYFGHPWLPALWFDYHNIIAGHEVHGGHVTNIYDILLITIYFGITVISLGLVLNWINLFKKRKWSKLIFDKSGLIGGYMFWTGVYTGFYFARHSYTQLPSGAFLIFAFGIPAILLLIKGPLLHIFGHKDDKKARFSLTGLLNYIMEWIVELLEIFSGYLANTLSFMRIAGLGIAHVSLMIAFATIAEMAAGAGGELSIFSYLILIAGNTLVIVLEGLSAGIQSLRLNYYEFFSKYFSGTGKAYAPISLKTRNQED